MADWMAYLWAVLGVLTSSLLPAAVTALWPAQAAAARGLGETAMDVFRKLWPGVRMLLASLVVGAAALVAARATGVELQSWWQAFLVGLGADRLVQVAVQLARRR